MKEDSKKQKHSFNIVDAIIIVGLIAVALFSISVISKDILGEKIINVHYTVRLDGVTSDNISTVKTGARAFASEKNVSAGIIEDIRVENAKGYVYSQEQDRFTEVTSESFYTVYIDLIAGCTFENGAYSTDSMRISENTEIELNIPIFYERAVITDVYKVDEQEEN